ncbi:MAG: peptide chain release factor 1 [Candidatus Babeliales bacterium]
MALDWAQVRAQYQSCSDRLSQPSLEGNERVQLQKEASRLQYLLERHDAVTASREALAKAQQEAELADAELKELYKDEVDQLARAATQAQQALDDLLFPPDPLDNSSVFLEIRAGTGGAEAALFAADLLKMYTNYALKKGWHASLADLSETDLGGIREAVLHIEGKNIYGHLKREAGVHRVQRVPKTETQGRIHTSTATVAVLPEGEDVAIAINPSDLRIDTYRAGGAGGQHVNKTDSAVRITHIPSGIVVACQDERSQHKNRAKAMKMLQARLIAAQQEKQQEQMSKERKEMVGGGMRSEKVRTYNYPQNRITDHQVELTLKKLDIVMQGDLDEIVEALMQHERELRRKNVSVLTAAPAQK